MSGSDDLIQSGPPPAQQGAAAANPIIGGYAPIYGVPGPYGQIQTQPFGENPNAYFDGAEFGPMNNPELIPQLQSQLIAAGLLDPDTYRPGVWDDRSVTGYRNVLELANRYGVSAQQALGYLMANPTAAQAARGRGGGGGGVSRRIRLTNANDLQAVANEVAPKTIGRRLTDDELRKFTNAYHSAERGETAGDPGVAAENLAREVAPTEASARDLVGVYEGFLQMITGGSGG